MYSSYHRLTRANTPASAPLRRFLPFSPWRAPERLRLKSQKSLGNPSLAGAKQFCRAEMCPDKERPAGNTCRISKGLDAVWAYFCPSKPCLPLSTDGSILQYFPPFVNEIFVNAPSCFSQPMGYNEIIEAVLIKPMYPPVTALPCLPPLGKGAKDGGNGFPRPVCGLVVGMTRKFFRLLSLRCRFANRPWQSVFLQKQIFQKRRKTSWSFAPF